MPEVAARVLVVEDEYLIAWETSRVIEDAGSEVIGPVGSLEPALAVVESPGAIDAAVLDVNIGGASVAPLADRLAALGVPFMFLTGYDVLGVPAAHRGQPCLTKPADSADLVRALRGLLGP